MLSWIRFAPGACALVVGLALTGCSPSGQSQLDEEKEPHFMLGRARVNAMDYQGAVEAFEQSLEVNPHSAQAHYQLALLYDTKEPDPAAAIYHYGQYLKFDPKADNAEVITQRIYTCKLQLAADVLSLPSTPAAQQQLEKLAAQNRQLQDEVSKWRAYYTSQLAAAAAKTNAPPPNNPAPQPVPAPSAPAVSAQPVAVNPVRSSPAAITRPRTHAVAAGETAVGIARKYGVKLSALEEANPGMNPGRIRVGQVLNLPPS